MIGRLTQSTPISSRHRRNTVAKEEQMKLLVCLVTAAFAIGCGPRIAHASGPIAVYALVDKVTFEPNADKPERVRISGVFITAEERSDSYSGPQRGYLYFSLPRQNQD